MPKETVWSSVVGGAPSPWVFYHVALVTDVCMRLCVCVCVCVCVCMCVCQFGGKHTGLSPVELEAMVVCGGAAVARSDVLVG